MVKRREFMKAATIAGGYSLLDPIGSFAARDRTTGTMRIDFQTYLPMVSNGKHTKVGPHLDFHSFSLP